MSLEKIIELTNATQYGSFGSFVGHCPTHNDKNKSLSITKTTDNKILLKCHAGCSQGSIIDFFKSNNAWHSQQNIIFNDKQALAKTLWEASDELSDNDHATRYFKLRGLILPSLPKSLRFNSNCYNSELKGNALALVCKIQNSGNDLIGVQRIYLDRDGNKLKVESPKKILGTCTGGFVELKADLLSDVIHITEGIETGLAIFSSFNETTLCAVSANNLSKVLTDKTVKTIHIWADKDKSGTGQREAEKAAKEFSSRGIQVFVHLPKDDIPEGSKGIDFLDVYVKNPSEISEEKSAGKLFTSEVLPIKMPCYDLPRLDDQYLPFVIRDWVFGQADRLNVAPESIAVPLFSIIGSLIGTKVAIQPKRHDYWTVYANLWGIIIAPPGTKKSAILNTSVKILNKIEIEENKKAQTKASDNADEIMEIEVKIKNTKKKLQDAIKDEDEETKIKCRKELKVLEKKEKEIKIITRRYSTSAFSLEKLIDMLGDNPNGLLISKDELSGLFESFKKKGQETTRQFLLEAWNGDGSYNYDIFSRPAKPLEKLCITLLGGTQPTVINKMLSEMRQDKNDDGFIQRFQLIAYPNQDIKPGFVDKELASELQDRVIGLIEKISNIESSRFGIKTAHDDTCFTKLKENSYILFSSYMDGIEKEVYQSENGGYKNHINKFGKLFSGLILVFHIIDNIETNRTNHHAPPHVVEMAIRWCDLFKAHAKKLYDTEYNFESLSGFALAKKISAGEIEDSCSIRALHRNGWTNLQTYQEIELAAQFLEKHNWLKIIENKPLTGRPSTVLRFNQNLLEFLNKEKWHE